MVILFQTCVLFFFFTKKKKNKKKKNENLFLGLNCSLFSLQLNVEKRLKIRAVFNEIHDFKLFSLWVYYGSVP